MTSALLLPSLALAPADLHLIAIDGDARIGLIMAAVIVAAIFVGKWIGKRNEARHTEAITALAPALGLQRLDDASAGPALLAELAHTQLLTRGRKRKALDLLTRREGEDTLTVFRFRCTVGSGQHQRRESHTVARFHNQALALPAFTLAPEHVFHKVGSVFGYQDIDFEDFPHFSKQYLLRGPDEQAVRARFDHDLLVFFSEAEGWSVEGAGNDVLVWQHGRPVPPERLDAFLADARVVRGAFR